MIGQHHAAKGRRPDSGDLEYTQSRQRTGHLRFSTHVLCFAQFVICAVIALPAAREDGSMIAVRDERLCSLTVP
jgi:hypothetical protein